MMLRDEERSRPAGDGTATQKNAGQALQGYPQIAPNGTAATLPAFAPEDAAAIAGGAFVVVVQLDEDRYRRRVFLTLAAAEKLAAKARDRGHVAHVMLAHVLPLGVVTP